MNGAIRARASALGDVARRSSADVRLGRDAASSIAGRRPTAARSGRAFSSPPSPAPRPTARSSCAQRWRPAPPPCWSSRPDWKAGTVPPSCRVDDPRRTLALVAARFFRAPAGHGRRRHRHQRQDLGRRLHSADLGGARPQGGEPRHHRRRRADGAAYGTLTTPDPVELHETLAARRRGRDASCAGGVRHGLDQHRLDGVRLAAGAFTNLRAIISTTIRRWRPISRPSCACSTSCPAGRHGGDRRRRCEPAQVDRGRRSSAASRS